VDGYLKSGNHKIWQLSERHAVKQARSLLGRVLHQIMPQPQDDVHVDNTLEFQKVHPATQTFLACEHYNHPAPLYSTEQNHTDHST